MVLINLLTLLLLAGSSSLSHAGTLRAKKGLSAGMGGPGKGVAAGKGPKAPGKGAEPTPTPTPTTTTPPTTTRTPTTPPPPPSPELGAPETTSVCGVQPPSLTGGCDVACDFLKFAEAGAQAVIGEIPVVGNFVSNLVGLFWPFGTSDAETYYVNTIEYIDAMIAQVEDTVFMSDMQVKYSDLANHVEKLSGWIKNDSPDRYEWVSHQILNTDCTDLNNRIVEQGLEVLYPQISNRGGVLGTSPVALLNTIANVGQACLAMRYVEIYEYNTTFSEPPQNNATVNASKATLDAWVRDYTTWAQNATQLALDWRTYELYNTQSTCTADDDTVNPCGSEGAVLSMTDQACFALGGPPPNVGSVVADSKGNCVCRTNFGEFVLYYQLSIMLQGFTDNLLAASRSIVPLWKYQTTESIEAGLKPSPVIRAATSLVDAYVPVMPQAGAQNTYTFPDTEMQNIYNVYNGVTSAGQRTDQITQITLIYESSVVGVVVSQVVGGQESTMQLGLDQVADDIEHGVYPLLIAGNERIVAVGAFDCGDPTTDCPMQGFAFKTAYVNASGAFAGEGRLLNPFGYPEDGPWIVAPQLAQARNDTFLPHVIAFNGWATQDSNGNFMVGAKIPVWLYESLE